MTHTIYLRFKNRDEAYDALRAAGLLALDLNGEEVPILDSHTHSIAIFNGQGLTRPGTYDHDGTELSPPQHLDGYHINWAAQYGPLPEPLQPFQIHPHNPLFRY